MKKVLFILLLNLLLFLNLNMRIVMAENDKINFSVFLYDENDVYINLIKGYLENLGIENSEKVSLTFYDGKNDVNIQRDQLEKVLIDGTDVILMNLVDISTAYDFISMVKEYNIPIILFNREPNTLESIKSYGKSIFIGDDLVNVGTLQGELIESKIKDGRIKDRNKNGYIDYIFLKGYLNDKETTIKSEAVIDYLKRKGINIQELDSEYGNYYREIAKVLMEGILIRYLDDIDLVISNNDEMAIGAIEALQEIGFNTGDPNKYIPVVGIDGTDAAISLINKGLMEGTILKDPEELARVMFQVGLNLDQALNPLEGTNYNFDDSGVAIRLKGSNIINKK